jgi:hypothetical protein
MYEPCTYLVVTYFPTSLPMYGTYFLQNWLPRWNRILTELRFIHNGHPVDGVLVGAARSLWLGVTYGGVSVSILVNGTTGNTLEMWIMQMVKKWITLWNRTCKNPFHLTERWLTWCSWVGCTGGGGVLGLLHSMWRKTWWVTTII